nr:uncharacterized protein LOC112030992 [Quercus suber]POF01646.1 uncharacterized protein CFP56_70351 [Quercus suber]
MHEDLESDTKEDGPMEGSTRILFSKEEKSRMRAPWQNALIIKPFGRKVGFNFLDAKIRSMWAPVGRMDCIDLGLDYYIVNFEQPADLDNILKGGPWFIGQQFLAIRQWEPGFKASAAEFTSVAMWIRLPELPIEFYEPSTLLKIGKAIGPVLKIDANTANGVRGHFARLCVQVNLEKPLLRKIYLGKIEQYVQYEGINALCFSCGRIGHKREACPYHIRENPKDMGTEKSHEPVYMGNDTPLDKGMEGKNEGYGEWMVVSRHKPPTKVAAKFVGSEVSDTAESSQAVSANSVYRTLGVDMTDGKRKAGHLVPSDMLKEADKTHKSSHRTSGKKRVLEKLKVTGRQN